MAQRRRIPGRHVASTIAGVRAGDTLHVTNGESAAGSLRATRLAGSVLAWNDALHEGPLAPLGLAELRPLRAGFLARHGWGDAGAIEAALAARDGQLEDAARAGRPIVLWFEHDLYDQLQLLQLLDALAGADGPVELVRSHTFLGAADELEALWPARAPVTPEQTALARTAWRAVCTGALEQALAADLAALPYLRPALARLREERAPRSLTARRLLGELSAGPRTPVELFVATQAAEEAAFLGDTWCFERLWALAEEGLVEPLEGAMPVPPPRGDHERFAAARLALTPAGAAAAREARATRLG
jgi:hypothetical protein